MVFKTTYGCNPGTLPFCHRALTKAVIIDWFTVMPMSISMKAGCDLLRVRPGIYKDRQLGLVLGDWNVPQASFQQAVAMSTGFFFFFYAAIRAFGSGVG